MGSGRKEPVETAKVAGVADDMDLDSKIFTLEASGSDTSGSGSCLFSILNLEKTLDKEDNQWKLVGPEQSKAENELKSQILRNGGKMFDVFDLQSNEDYEITLVISSGDKEWDLDQARKYLIDKVEGGGLYRDIFQARYVRHCLIRGKMLNLNNYRFLQSVFYPYEAYDVLTQKVKWSSLQRKPPPDYPEDDEQEKDKEQKKQSETKSKEKNPIPVPSNSNCNGKVVPLRLSPRGNNNADPGIANSDPVPTSSQNKDKHKGQAQEKDKQIQNGDVNRNRNPSPKPKPETKAKTLRFEEETAKKVPAPAPVAMPKKPVPPVIRLPKRVRPVRPPSPGQIQAAAADGIDILRPGPPSGRLSDNESFQIPYSWRPRPDPDPAADLADVVPRKKPRPEVLAPPVSPISSSEDEDVQVNSDDEDDEDEDEEDHVSASIKVRAYGLGPKKTFFTKEEMQAMLDYVCEKKLHEQVKGNAMWKALQKKNLIKGRTFHSMRNNFLRSILPKGKLEKFKISDKDLKIFRRVRGN